MAPRIGRRRRWPAVLALGLLAGAASAVWIGYTARSAQQHLSAASTTIPQVRQAWLAGDPAAAGARLAAAQRDTAAARARTHDPIWAIAARIPVLGTPAKTVRGLTEAVDQLATVSLPQLASASAISDPASLVGRGGVIDVGKLAAIAPQLQSAATSLAQQQAKVSALPPSWLPAVAAARLTLLDELAPVTRQARLAAGAAQQIPPVLGAQGTRRYFLGFQNPAEARGTGGLLDAFAILTADKGRLTLARVGSNAQLPDLPATIPGIDPTYLARYGGQGALRLWVSSNLSPDFPEVARAWSAMWKAATGERIDGVISMDPTALAAILRSTGPVNAPGVGQVDGDSVTALILKDQYRLIPSDEAVTAQRKSLMLGVGTVAIDKLLSGQSDYSILVKGLTEAAKTDHVNVYSAATAEQTLMESAGIGGDVPRTSGPFAEAVVVDAAGTKLAPYLHQSTRYQVTRCSAKDRAVTVTVTLRNRAPRSGLPRYVTRWADGVAATPGSTKVNLQVLLGQAAAVRSATLDGAPISLTAPNGTLPKTLPGGLESFLDQGVQAGRPSFGLDLDLPAGASRVLQLSVIEPASTEAPTLPLQSMVNPPTATADISACRP